MQNNQNIIFVYDNFSSSEPILLGRLFADTIRGCESFSFEYDEKWLSASDFKVGIDPDLIPYAGRQYPDGKPVFGVFADSMPDRWGRTLIKKKEQKLAGLERRTARTLQDRDFLLSVCDETRMGGLRFKADENGPFLYDDKEFSVLPSTMLKSLEEASRQFENDPAGADERLIDRLLISGASLGGARPKATVADAHGQMWIAKFPSVKDSFDAGAWEKTAHDLARMCGLNVPESKLEKLSKTGSTFLVRRFDRDGSKRIHYASAMTLLGKTDGSSAADGVSYLDLAAIIESHGAEPEKDLTELWKRIVFNMAISNTDDHLRNHAFIFTKNGWRLSPLFDANPTPYGNKLSLNVDENDSSISLALAIKTAARFGISENEAAQTAREIAGIIRQNWEKLAEKNSVPRSRIKDMSPAFKVCYEPF